MLGEAGRGARWGGGAMEEEVVVGGIEEETTGDLDGACTGGGMDAVLVLAPTLELVRG